MAQNGVDETDGSPPEDAFALVGNGIRADILRAFGDARVEEREAPELTFSEVRARTDVDIDSSQFNYHLQQLVGHYLEETESGYRMRPEGRLLYQTLRAGTFDRLELGQTIPADFDCYYCGASVEATFEDGTARIQCPDCEYLYDIAAIPPGGIVDGEPDLERVSEYNHHTHLSFARGICPNCGHTVGTSFLDPEDVPFQGADRHECYIYRPCDHCGSQLFLSPGEALLADAGLIAFCHDHGLDVLSTPLWELEFAATDRSVTVESRNPWRISLAVQLDGEALELTMDEALYVVERNRRSIT